MAGIVALVHLRGVAYAAWPMRITWAAWQRSIYAAWALCGIVAV